MDEYLQCLYDYILEVRRDETLLKTPEFRAERKTMLRAWDAMEAALTGEQQKIVEEFLSAKEQTSIREDEWLFLEGVALGGWLARSSDRLPVQRPGVAPGDLHV